MRANLSTAPHAVGLILEPVGQTRKDTLISLAPGIIIQAERMYRKFLIILALALIAALPVWGYNSNWSYGPFIAVLFLLSVNLINFVLDDPLISSKPREH
jgi:hypothetical protein